MFILTFFIVVAFVLYLNSQNFFDAQELLENATYIVGISAALCFAFLFVGDFENEVNPYFLSLIPLYALCIYLIKSKTKQKPLNIEANQQRYFNEVKASDIVRFYSVRKDIKNNRVEALVNKESKKLIINGLIRPSFFMDLKHLELTKIESTNELEKSKIFSVIFKKIQGFIKDLEARVDYEKVLKENGNYAEFFLMDLWERYTYKFNISLANLEVLATNKKEIELLGALDLLNLNCVKRKGAVLYYKYIEFKDRIKDFVPLEVNAESQSIDSKDNKSPKASKDSKSKGIDIIPKEEGFDEKYALENDSDRTAYKGMEEKNA
ncbi:hypothetical protein [Helicobacter turcicus]|uniref:Uncharacterized protein n=1 Tax=Helicobacter turcicus TaxID=2867412 RepID=A0ABS7JPF4_9HELI|nr:hypothetical protein [Helicobacter turcicus]MBX7491250.1 hypothetical protein [Helicobacter turcicus]MBX7546111.1 hypothetical protein [Helicobacter turcicus]